MKKIILTILSVFIFNFSTMAAEYLPKYKTSMLEYGIGLYFGEGTATVYAEPNDKSKILANLKWDADYVDINGTKVEPKNVFAVFSPQKSLSGFIALDEIGTEYTKIIYDNSKQLSGWIKNSPENKVFYWRQLFYRYGKTRGLYMFADTLKTEKLLRVSPDEDSEISYEFIYPKYIRLQLIKGNWALVKVVDYDNEQKVGWFRWRNSDGTLNLFPEFY